MAEALKVKPKDVCRWDIVSLGEVMLRLDPGEGRIHTTRTFQVWEGGGEYNVALGLKRAEVAVNAFGQAIAVANGVHPEQRAASSAPMAARDLAALYREQGMGDRADALEKQAEEWEAAAAPDDGGAGNGASPREAN